MSKETPAPIVSDAEIEAALLAAESDGAGIPSLDDDQQAVVHVPVDTAPRTESRKTPPAPSDRVAVAAKLPAEKPPEQVRARGPGRLGKLLRRLSSILSVWQRRVPGAGLVLDWAGCLWQAIYAAVDWVLSVLNRPFEWMSPDARRMLGFLAMVTIFMSLLAGTLLPHLCPPRDAITQLASQTAEVESQEQGVGTPPDGG